MAKFNLNQSLFWIPRSVSIGAALLLSFLFVGKRQLLRKILGRKLGSFEHNIRTLWARCSKGEDLLCVQLKGVRIRDCRIRD